MKSYEELVKRIPLVKTLVEEGEAEALEALYKNVGTLKSHIYAEQSWYQSIL